MRSLSLSIAMILAGAVSGIAGTSVWSYDKPKGNDMQPARWGDVYYQPKEDGATGELTTTTEGYQQFTTKLVIEGSSYSAAGFSLVWKQNGTVDLSSYPGLCLTYKADRPFRVDFKQTSVTDYNYYGIILDAQTEFVSKFIDFQSLAQEGGWGTELPLDLTQQEAVQINYKEGIAANLDASDANRTKNVITVSAVSLGECESSVVVDDGLKVLEPYDKPQKVTIKESDTLKIDLKKVFSAKETDDVILTTTMTKSVLKQVSPTGDVTLNDVVAYVPTGIDKDTTLTLIFIALKGTESAIVQLEVSITDEADGPVGPTCPGDPECPDDPPAENHPTVALPPYDTEVPLIEMLETDTMKIALGDLFADEDNDRLLFVVDMSVPLMKTLTSLDKATLQDTVAIIPTGIKKDTSLIIAVYATDGKSDVVTVQYIIKITNVDLNRPPVAVDTAYTVNEDQELVVSITNGLRALGSDPDGDDFIAIPIDSTKHGSLSQFSQFGSFVYKPEANFHGDDTLTYVLVETANHTMMSSKGTVVIHVLPVNDAPTFAIADSTFLKDTLMLDVDFDEDTVKQIKIPTKSIVFSDLEVTEGTQKFTYGAKGTKIVAAVDSVNASYYYISLKPVAKASGVATIFFYATDGLDSAGVTLGVKLVSPKDLAQAEADEYTTFNDSILTVSAKQGVLANDKYPEGVTKGMEAELAQKPAHGTLVLNKDGSFKYTPVEGYEGIDYFGYYAVVNGTKSKAARVTIVIDKRNLLPTVVVKSSTLDTTVTEDFATSRALKYPKSVVASWFKDPEGDTLSYSAKSKDGKLKVEITDKGTLEINSVEDSTGKAYVVVTATDKKSGSKSFEFCVTITPVNDKPKLLRPSDTMYVANSGWKVQWKLDTLVTDVDGDEITFTPNETSALTKYMTISLKGSVLTVTAIDGLKYKDGQKFALGVKASDPGKLNVTVPLYIIVGEKPQGLMPQKTQPKASWQNAVMAKRGSVSIMDLQGRKIWSAKLPVNPAEVQNASAQVQGRKLLRVNNQTWTIK